VLIESVPNYSEGRRGHIVDALAAAVAGTPGVFLLDRTSDASHNRSVLTMAGEADAVTSALEATIEVAIRDIDMELHTGEHPRIGAVDVIPFVPLGDTTLDDAIALARTFGRRVADRFEIPVFLYARAALRPDRIRLADVRRGGYEGLRDEIRQNGRGPDFGPDRTHPRAGAVAVGARPFLIAWNINLESADVELAKRIARRVRESGGGIPAVQANGFMIEELDCAQVSMNLLDFATTPMWRVWEEVATLRCFIGHHLCGREKEHEVGLEGVQHQRGGHPQHGHAGADPDAPVEHRFADAARFLQLRDPDPRMALELRLAAARARASGRGDPRAEGGSTATSGG